MTEGFTWVLSKEETQQVFNELDRVKGCAPRDGEPAKVPTKEPTKKPTKVQKKTDDRYALAARLQYGAGLRVSELVRLRIKDVDLGRGRVKGYASRDWGE